MASVAFVACQVNPDDAGGSSDNQPVEYTITVNALHGTVEFVKTKAKAGETVKLTKCKADEGYNLKTMSIKKANGEDVIEDKQNQTFVMPDSNVTVDVIFEKSETPEHTPVVDKSDLKTDEGESDGDGTNNGENDNTEVTPAPVDETTEEPKPSDTAPAEDTSTVAPATVADPTYGFVPEVDYTVYKDNTAFPFKVNGSVLISISTQEKFVNDKDYTVDNDKNEVYVITDSRLYDWLTPQNLEELVDDNSGNGNGESGNETPTDTYKVFHGHDNGNYYLAFTNYKNDGYTIDEDVTFLIQDANGNTPTGLYLVKTYVTDADGNPIKVDGKDITVDYKDHTVSFKIPDSNVIVRADFYDVKNKNTDDSRNLSVCISGKRECPEKFSVGMCFDEKIFDNLEEINGTVTKVVNYNSVTENKVKYVFLVATRQNPDHSTGYLYNITSNYDNTSYELCVIVDKEIFLAMEDAYQWTAIK